MSILQRIFLYLGVFLAEVLLIYLLLGRDSSLESHLRERRSYCLEKIDYHLSRDNVKLLFLWIRDYISFGGDYKELIKRKESIEKVLRSNFLTSDAYFLSKAIVDKSVRPEFLRFAKVSNDVYIKYISSVYYYTLVSRELKEAIGSSYDQWKKSVSSYKWLVDLIEKPVFSFAKNYVIGKLKDLAKTSTDSITVGICLSLLVSLEYRDEIFYNSFLGSNSPMVFVVSTIGLLVGAQESSQKLKEYNKYSYFIFNKGDLYRYYSILPLMKFTEIYPDIYLKILNFDIIDDYKEATICLVMLIN